MAHDVVDGFFKNQINIAPDVRVELQIRLGGGRVKFQINLAAFQYFFGVLPHSPRQAEQAVFFRIDRPDNIAHRRHRFAGNLGDRTEQIVFAGFTVRAEFISQLLLRDLAQNSDFRQICADVVVQIGGDARPHIGNFEQAR